MGHVAARFRSSQPTWISQLRAIGTLTTLLLAATQIVGCRAPVVPIGKSSTLNVLLIIVDDLRPDLGAYGHPLVQSPNIDRLAARGVRFERAYAQYPLCNPSRTSLLTGLRPDQTGVLDNETSYLTTAPQVTTLPEQFGMNGYTTASIGKVFHGSGRHGKVRNWIGENVWDIEQFPGGPSISAAATDYPESSCAVGVLHWAALPADDLELVDGRIASSAIEVLDRSAGQQPLFLAVGFTKPHLPFKAPKKYFDLYSPAAVDRYDRQQPFAVQRYPPSETANRNERLLLTRAYWACTSFVDAQIGRLLSALDRLDLWDSTIVVLTSDHGFHLGEHGLWRKASLHEVAVRVPLIVAAPESIRQGSSSDALVELIDVFPTLMDLLGLQTPDGLPGTSFAPSLSDPHAGAKQAAFSQITFHRSTGRSVRTDRRRWTEWTGTNRSRELYDLRIDPFEIDNLVGENAVDADVQKAVIKKLRALLRRQSKS